MIWQLLALFAVAVAVGLHFWWRNRFTRAAAAAETELQDLRRKALAKEAQLQAQQTAFFDSMAEGLLLLDESGRIQMANRACAGLLGFSSEVRGQTLLEAVRLHELTNLVETLGHQKQVLGYELQLTHPRELWLEVNAAAIHDYSGIRHGTVLVFHDLTRIKQLERTREEFVGNVSHELRTPLSLIKGYAETLLDGARDNPEVATRFLQTIDRNAERLRLLIEDLLTISELESGRIQLNLQSIALDAAVGRVLNDFDARARAKAATLVNLPSGLKIRADAARLEQVLGNLVDNAIKYGRPGGTVTISAATDGTDFIRISVQDDGPGIPPEALERIFERFYRIDKARSREQGGTGLGLSIVKHLVQTHGGKVWATSKPGQGATFYFTLLQDK